jgi:hypothetical protein
MPKRDAKGNWIYSEEEQGEIAMSSEARYQAAKRLRAEERAEKVAENCANGKHEFDGDSCKHCDAAKPKEDVAPKGKRKNLW